MAARRGDKRKQQTQRLEYVDIDSLPAAERNPKRHALDALAQSIRRFGFADAVIVDGRTGRLVSGHGRVEALRAMRDGGESPPAGVRVEGGRWLVPAQTGWASKDDREAEAFLVAANRLVEAGGWDEAQLEALLRDIARESSLDGLGLDADVVEELLRETGDATADDGHEYTHKVESPVYVPSGPCPDVSELFDASKARQLESRILSTEGLSEDVKRFLLAAAQRHVRFSYQAIAEFYAHATPEVQRLMEESALVIVDFRGAIENGFVKLTKTLAELVDDATR